MAVCVSLEFLKKIERLEVYSLTYIHNVAHNVDMRSESKTQAGPGSV